jgi:Retrotransposon gag protein
MDPNQQPPPQDLTVAAFQNLQLMVQQLQAQVQQQQQQIQAQAQTQAQTPAVLVGDAAMHTIKPAKPPSFAGERKESIDSWLFQLEQHFALTNLPAERQAVFAASFFKDNAVLWWRSFVGARLAANNNQATLITWDEFTTATRAQFRPINAERVAREKLMSLKQTGSVFTYTHQFRTILLELPDMAEADRLFAYVRGLKSNIAALVQVSNPQTVSAAAATAESVDAIFWEHRPNQSSAAWAPRPTRHQGPTPMELDSIGNSRTPITDAERTSLRRTGGCFYCRESGHIARHCPRKKNVNAVEVGQKPDLAENGFSQ